MATPVSFFSVMMRAVSLVLGLVAIVAMSNVATAESGASAWSENDHVAVRLVSATKSAGDAGRITTALEFQIQPGWKIYWRSPGDAGLPPVPDWHGAINVSESWIDWPIPERFSIFDLETFGYENEVLLPITVVPERPGEAVRLAGTVNYLACEEICIPYSADLALDLPEGSGEPSRFGHKIDRFRARVPIQLALGGDAEASLMGLGLQTLEIETAGNKSELLFALRSDRALSAPDAIIEGPPGTIFSKPAVEVAADGRQAVLRVTAEGPKVAALGSETLTVTLIDGDRAIEVLAKPGTSFSGASEGSGVGATGSKDERSLFVVLAIALLGGLILNLMPCVLPVLSIKLISVVSKGGKGRAQVRGGFLAAAAGIFVSFMALAAGVASLREAGMAVGWGTQFQQPIFLALMVALLTLFACNLFGMFEFRLPGFLSDRAATAGGANGYFGDFLTGAFATLLATPCSAPFLGTAVGFALSQGTTEIFAVFAALGLGLALPYLLVAAMPGIARFLPKPGAWMRWLKWVMALALIGTALWLLSVLAAQVGTQNAGSIGFLSLVAALVLATRHVDGSRMGRIAWPLSAFLAVTTVLLPLTFEETTTRAAVASTQQDDAVQWVAFDEAAIAGHVAAGRAVLVDVTADWCVTCQWNKKTVIEQGAVFAWLNTNEVVAMRADWTKPDRRISDYLARHGRYGIPFNVLYGPAAPDGIMLPELLTETAVLSAAVNATGDSSLVSR